MFRHIPYLQLGVRPPADWVANIVLYIPFAFFSAAWFSYGPGVFARRLSRIVLVVAAGTTLAVAMEFTQISFAPSMVSLNDLIAEVIGTVIGIALWESAGRRLSALGLKVMAGGPASARRHFFTKLQQQNIS